MITTIAQLNYKYAFSYMILKVNLIMKSIFIVEVCRSSQGSSADEIWNETAIAVRSQSERK